MLITKPSAQKSRMMGQVRTKGTTPELLLRSALYSAGFRFRLHRKDLPGRPDIVLPKYKTIIFVHGCFWHHHDGCIKSKMPKTNFAFWQNKIAANVRRDKLSTDVLIKFGWKVFIAWECEIKQNAVNVAQKIEQILNIHLPIE